MSPIPKALAALVPIVLSMGHAAAADLPDLAMIDRTIRKEPTYTSKQPLYGLAVFGPKAQARVWMVLDKSKPDADDYDVLHIDLNADGDMTGPGERLTFDEDFRFRVADFKDPATGVKHRNFNLRFLKKGEPEVMLSLQWRDQFRFGGGYPENPDDGYLRFAPKPADAPILWVHGDAPFRFQRWYGGKLTIGGDRDFKVFLGQPGLGRSSFCAAQEHFLPAGESVKATLIYRDAKNKEQRLVCELKERC